MSPPPSSLVEITEALRIPEDELSFVTSRSSGPGGQNVNKVETRVTLLLDVAGSPSLDAAQKERIREELATRINKEGVLRVSVQRHRTQAENRREAVERLRSLLADALSEDPERRPTRVPRSARRYRREDKRRRAQLKRLRSVPRDWNGA